jgi:predicted nuclease of predicted toxin-antitoxin system
MTQFLADENFPGLAVARLRAAGNDVVWMRTDAPGIADPDIFARAVRESRVVLTFDKDFGELAFNRGHGKGSGVVLFRVSMSPPGPAIDFVVKTVLSRQDWLGHFSVAEPGRIRMRPMR